MTAINVLLVEDNPGDVLLARKSLTNNGVRLSVVGDGVEAMEYLRKEGSYRDVSRPDLILLDLNLPFRGGREVLGHLKRDTGLRTIPVVVLSSSSAANDIEQVYQLGAACYVQKPLDLEAYKTALQGIEQFWTRHVSFAG